MDLRAIAGFRTEMEAYEDPDEEGAVRPEDLPRMLEELRGEMLEAAKALDFERAAEVRDRIRALEAGHLGIKAARAPAPKRAMRSPGSKMGRGGGGRGRRRA
jgi:hypothetical protein